ncbi:restriction endonuclease subunit S [Thermococcus sp. MV11]|uniref:restriction endonuclease subunit S n=1 Tax=Thermococcus sp. MV11 TaxID=1638267 RepID=UPI0014301934|nr:restriction endonuclease subunit S [Thermococcus sp. MV11]NJE04104.1 restriction endonuclease subunit S [Thermococcus sp. MV11]
MSEALPAFQFYRETRFKEVELNGRKVRIPEEWEVVELGEVVTIRRKKSIRNVSEVAVIPMEKVPQDNNLFAEFEIMPIEEVKSSTYCAAGDLLLAKITPSFENGKQGIVPFNIPNGFALATTEVYPLVPSEDLDVFFLFYLLKDKRFRRVLEVRMIGTTGRQRVQKTDLIKLQIPLPPLEEQKKIAEVLRSIDEAIQAVEESIAKLERLKKGTMETLLTRGINHTRFKTVELNGRKVEIPEEWEVVELGEVAERIKKSIDPQKLPNELFELYSIPAFHETGKPEIVKGSSIKSTKFVIDVGVVLFGKLNPRIPKIWLVTGESDYKKISSTEFIPLKPVRNLKSEFLYYALQDKYFIQISQQVVTGSTPSRQRINPNKFMKLQIPLPPLSEQKKIAEILRTIDGAIEAKREKREKLERMKRAVMEKLLTGEVRVR